MEVNVQFHVLADLPSGKETFGTPCIRVWIDSIFGQEDLEERKIRPLVWNRITVPGMFTPGPSPRPTKLLRVAVQDLCFDLISA